MEIEVRAKNVEVTDELREYVDQRFARIGSQVPDSAVLRVELWEERNPSIADSEVAEAHLLIKGTTLTASHRSPQMMGSIKAVSKDIRRQLKRVRQAPRTEARRFAARLRRSAA
jgi:putative sigma-54 modulation protein